MPKSSHKLADLKTFLDEKADQYNRPGFIENDPISIPHRFSKKQDIEIAGLFAAVLAWGQRKTIIKSCNNLLEKMDQSPHEFIMNYRDRDLRSFEDFKHRTFNGTDLLYFFTFLKKYYSKNDSLESLFKVEALDVTMENGLINFHRAFFDLPEFPHRTKKHIATPERKSACKRINMYLRWMVRDDKKGVDFGIWKSLSASQLICPIDLHVERVARKLKLIRRKQMDWQTAVELTQELKKFDPTDPVKYDFALFGLGIEEKF
ncbi:MAG: TIGR02757 family protein [Cyclobacteriaceae bacterium]|nr:TIGR02757 family protein [Cyclobacteriaceae bacterium]